MSKIHVVRSDELKIKPDQDKLVFGQVFTDHMFVMDYVEGKGWHSPRIEPYGPIDIDPSIMVLHYGQAIFEGMKAFRLENGDTAVFRPRDYLARLNRSAERVCIPEVDESIVYEGLMQLLALEKDWVPGKSGTALYIRPFIIATDPYLGVRPSNEYKLLIILSPVGAYYPEGFKPVKIMATDEYVRAVRGGLGSAKTPANYAASLMAQEVAKKAGFTQVLWLDGVEQKYIEEVGTMNIFFVIDNELVTPSLESGSILAGMTRDSVIQVAKSWGIPVRERKLSIEEVFELGKSGRLQEIFGTGTAAVISSVGLLSWKGENIIPGNGDVGPLTQKLYDYITGIQYGLVEDPFNWIVKV